ncbi:hypothetical protein FOL47_003975 [Perkinsus chesapeaki]|uniref:Uncharacterized protein n=1 Tax=Perkinsus chesapeaki TaxID=330153 RepID=A0A7J6MZB7_PERCH|nr:hypothetical protein FOL47_003975 [Perkinsus chesapeaki]
MHTHLGLPPIRQPTISLSDSHRGLAASPLGPSSVPIVQVVWIDRNAFKPNRPPYDFEAMAPVTRLKRFKTAAACVKWLNDRRNRAGCNQQVISTGPNLEAASKSCHRTSQSGSNVIISTPSGRSNSSSILSSAGAAYRRSPSGTGPFPTIVCRVATEKEASEMLDADGGRRVDLRLVVSAREAAVLLDCLSIEGHDGSLSRLLPFTCLTEISVAGGCSYIIPPKPFRSIEVYVYHRCAFEKPRKDAQVTATHELVAEVYPTLEDAVMVGVMDPSLHPGGPSTAVSESSSPGGGGAYGIGSERGDPEQEEEYPSYFPELRYWWCPGPQPAAAAAWYVPGGEVAREHQQRLVRLICAPTPLTKENHTQEDASAPAAEAAYSQTNKVVDPATQAAGMPGGGDGVEAPSLGTSSSKKSSSSASAVCSAALPHPSTYAGEDSSANCMWSPATALLVPCIPPPPVPPPPAVMVHQQAHGKASHVTDGNSITPMLDNVYYTDPFGGHGHGVNQVSMGMSPLAIYQYLTNLRRQRAAAAAAVVAHDAEKELRFRVCNDRRTYVGSCPENPAPLRFDASALVNPRPTRHPRPTLHPRPTASPKPVLKCVKDETTSHFTEVMNEVDKKCKSGESRKLKRFCEFRAKEPDTAAGYLFAAIGSFKYAMGYCAAKNID